MINYVYGPEYKLEATMHDCAVMGRTEEEKMWIRHLDKPLASKLRNLADMPEDCKRTIDDLDEELREQPIYGAEHEERTINWAEILHIIKCHYHVDGKTHVEISWKALEAIQWQGDHKITAFYTLWAKFCKEIGQDAFNLHAEYRAEPALLKQMLKSEVLKQDVRNYLKRGPGYNREEGYRELIGILMSQCRIESLMRIRRFEIELPKCEHINNMINNNLMSPYAKEAAGRVPKEVLAANPGERKPMSARGARLYNSPATFRVGVNADEPTMMLEDGPDDQENGLLQAAAAPGTENGLHQGNAAPGMTSMYRTSSQRPRQRQRANTAELLKDNKFFKMVENLRKTDPKVAKGFCFGHLCSLMKHNPKWPEELREYTCNRGNDCYWWHGPKPNLQYALARPVPRDPVTGKVRLMEKWGSTQSEPATSQSREGEVAAAGVVQSDDDVSEPFANLTLCQRWASGLGCMGGPQCPGLQYHVSPSPDELFAAQCRRRRQ